MLTLVKPLKSWWCPLLRLLQRLSFHVSRKVIESLLFERNELITNLNVAASKRIEAKEAKQNDHLANLMEVQWRRGPGGREFPPPGPGA